MTQKKSDIVSPTFSDSEPRKSTRIENAPPDLFDPNQPRLGRRESEPHSIEVTYMHDVLALNFPTGRVLWDLHHYFVGKTSPIKGKKIDIQFDISFFKELSIPHTISSYNSSKYDQKIPDLAVNVLSKTTWRNDLSENVDVCKNLKIPVYAIFSPFKVASSIYNPPFLRVYILEQDGSYREEELRSITLKEGGELDPKKIIDTSAFLPFRLGLMQLNQQHDGELPLFRLIFIEPSELKIFPSSVEKAKAEAQEAKAEAQEAKAEAQEAEKKLKEYQEKFGSL
ncbi:MAG: Uma2 family endonuclease [Promethearchaeota archaeon]|nr:MAG: Uma2 family endonuclease [Candidatus Lokiarchaeota archaeon]